MFTCELMNFIASRNYYVGGDDLLFVIDTRQHPQIDHIKYDTFQHKYEMWDKEGNYISFYAMPYTEAQEKGLIKKRRKGYDKI